MVAQTGAAFLLKISNGAVPAAFDTVAGLRTTQISVAGQAVVVTNLGSGGWRTLLNGGGARSIAVAATGVFMGSDAEAAIFANALSGTIAAYQLSFEDGHTLTGGFLVQKLAYAGDYDGERTYTMQLESSGAVVWA
jgi:TP901-1 family phage major tail protein